MIGAKRSHPPKTHFPLVCDLASVHTQHLLGVVEDFKGRPALAPATSIGHIEN